MRCFIQGFVLFIVNTYGPDGMQLACQMCVLEQMAGWMAEGVDL